MENQTLTGYPSVDRPWLKNYPNGAAENVVSGIDMRAYDFMCSRVKEHLDMPALEYLGAKITYAQLINNIEKWTRAFSKHGISKGDFVSICLPNVPEIVYCFYALNRLGAIANFIDPRAASNEIRLRINRTHSKLLIVIENICNDKIVPILADTDALCIVVSPTSAFRYSGFSISPKRLMVQLALLHRKKVIERGLVPVLDFLGVGTTEPAHDVPFSPHIPISALYTSGTTADTMSAGLFSNENYNAMVKNMAYGATLKPGKRFLGVIPFFSAYGSFNGMHNALCNAWTIVMVPIFKPNQFANLIIKHKINVALGVPKFWEQFIDHRFKRAPPLEIPVCGGDWISPTQVERINKAFAQFASKPYLAIGYGATEFGGCVTVTSDSKNKYNSDSVGTFLPGNTGMVIDPDTEKELPYEQAGELCVSGPTMMLRYLDEPEKTAAITVQKDGMRYYRTGDLVRISKEGTLFFCDRYKRVMMRPDGHTVSCSLIENAIISHPSVQSCAVVGLKVSQNQSGVVPTAFVVLKGGETASQSLAKDLDLHCSASIGERERALAITFVSSLPYTPAGKVDFRWLETRTFHDGKFYIIDPLFFE